MGEVVFGPNSVMVTNVPYGNLASLAKRAKTVELGTPPYERTN